MSENCAIGEGPPLAERKQIRLVATLDDGGAAVAMPGRSRFRVLSNLAGLQKGSGLGLAICKRIISEHDGELPVAARAGRGSAFYVALPAARR